MTAEDAAYRALAAFRVPAAERRAFAVEVAEMLTDVPRDLLWRGTEEDSIWCGVTGERAHRAINLMRSVPSVRLRQAAAAAVTPACRACWRSPMPDPYVHRCGCSPRAGFICGAHCQWQGCGDRHTDACIRGERIAERRR